MVDSERVMLRARACALRRPCLAEVEGLGRTGRLCVEPAGVCAGSLALPFGCGCRCSEVWSCLAGGEFLLGRPLPRPALAAGGTSAGGWESEGPASGSSGGLTFPALLPFPFGLAAECLSRGTQGASQAQCTHGVHQDMAGRCRQLGARCTGHESRGTRAKKALSTEIHVRRFNLVNELEAHPDGRWGWLSAASSP